MQFSDALHILVVLAVGPTFIIVLPAEPKLS